MKDIFGLFCSGGFDKLAFTFKVVVAERLIVISLFVIAETNSVKVFSVSFHEIIKPTALIMKAVISASLFLRAAVKRMFTRISAM